jgi:hypothetical protein
MIPAEAVSYPIGRDFVSGRTRAGGVGPCEADDPAKSLSHFHMAKSCNPTSLSVPSQVLLQDAM